MKRTQEIGEYCRHFRVTILQTTIRLICKNTGTNTKTLSAFECGRSNNMEHIFKYVDYCTPEQKIMLTTGIAWILRGDKK